MNKFDLKNTRKIIYNGENIKKIYLGDNLVYIVNFSYPIVYEINNVTSFEKYLPKGVNILGEKLENNKLNVLVGEGDITFKVNSGITKIEKLKHNQASSCERLFYNCPNLQKVDLTEFNTDNVTTFKDMFAYCNALNELITTGLNTKNVNDMEHCFYACDFRKLDLRDFNTQNVTNMRSMFGQCIYLEEVNLSSFDTSKVEDFTYMFLECNALKILDLTEFDTSGIKDKEKVRGMFSGVPESCEIYVSDNWTFTEEETDFIGKFIRRYPIKYTIKKVSDINSVLPKNISIIEKEILDNEVKIRVGEGNIDFSYKDEIISVERLKHKQHSDCQAMFTSCKNVQKIDLSEFNTEDVCTFKRMFAYCRSLKELNLTGLNTKKVNTMYSCFMSCETIKKIDLSGFDTQKVTDMSYSFANCYKLEEVNLSSFDTSKVREMYSMFGLCGALKSLDLRSFDTRKVEDGRQMFSEVPPTCKIYVGENWTLTEKETDFKGKFIRV